jgi:hypothetical protein
LAIAEEAPDDRRGDILRNWGDKREREREEEVSPYRRRWNMMKCQRREKDGRRRGNGVVYVFLF